MHGKNYGQVIYVCSACIRRNAGAAGWSLTDNGGSTTLRTVSIQPFVRSKANAGRPDYNTGFVLIRVSSKIRVLHLFLVALVFVTT